MERSRVVLRRLARRLRRRAPAASRGYAARQEGAAYVPRGEVFISKHTGIAKHDVDSYVKDRIVLRGGASQCVPSASS